MVSVANVNVAVQYSPSRHPPHLVASCGELEPHEARGQLDPAMEREGHEGAALRRGDQVDGLAPG